MPAALLLLDGEALAACFFPLLPSLLPLPAVSFSSSSAVVISRQCEA